MNPRQIPPFGLWRAAVLALIAGSVSAADYPTTVSGLNPLAYYRLNENVSVPAPDWATNSGSLGLSGYGYYVGAVVHPDNGALVAQTGDTAASFAGGRVSIPYTAALNPTTAFTVECWAYKTAGSGYPLGVFSAVYYVGGNERNGWLIYDNDGNWNFRMGDMGGYVVNISGGSATINTWYHLAATFDGTTARLYVNGVEVNSAAPSRPYTGNTSWPTEIGSASAFGRNFSGVIDEAAMYPTALPASEVLAHYQNGTNAAPAKPYQQLVLDQNPIGYWRLNEPNYSAPDPSTLPAAANAGSLAAAANGKVYPGIFTAKEGPPFTGMGSGNTAFHFSGSAGNVGFGNPDGLNNLSNITMMAWIKSESSAGLRDIIAHGYVQNPNQELFFRINAGAYQAGSWETGGTVSSAPGVAAADVGQWVLLTATYETNSTTWKLYRYDQLIASSSGGGWTAMTADWSVGSRGDNTSDQRYFAGTIDEPAIFGRALTQAEIQQILWSGNIPPIFAKQPQAPSGQIIAGAPVTVPATVSGTPTITYQWMRSNTNVSGQTTSTLTFANITTNDAGSYVLVAQNPYGSSTSSVVTLTVTFPTEPTALARASGRPAYNTTTHAASLTQVTLYFTGPLAAEGGDPSKYTIPGLGVTGAQFANLNTTVILTTTAQTQGQIYTVTVRGVTDGIGRPLAKDTADFQAWVASPANGITFEYYYHNEGTTVPGLLEDPLFPDKPSMRTNLWAFDSRVIFPDDTVEQYGARMAGVFVPAVSGNYRFFLRSDDSSRVFLNPNGASPDGKIMILDETGCCGDWNKALAYTNQSAIPLIGDQPYYIEMLYKEGGGGDYGKVAAQLDGTGSPALGTANTAIDPESLNGPAIGWPYAPADAGGALAVTGPDNITVQANHPVLFTVTASNPANMPIYYKWFRGTVEVAGATGPSLAFVPTAPGSEQIKVEVSKVGSVVTRTATLTVSADTDVPTVAAARGSVYLNQVVVSFSQLMGTADAANYTIAGFTTTNAVLDASGSNVVVQLDKPLVPGQEYSLTVRNAADVSGTAMTSATVPVKAFVLSRGLMRFDYFGHMSYTETTLDNLLADPRYPNSPDWSGFLTAFDTRTIFPDDLHNGYGARITGLFLPPTTGKYAFFMKSDDSSRFWFNPDGSDPLDTTFAIPTLEETSCCGQFSKIGMTNTADSVAGQLYYVEAVYKEGGGGDYFQAATKLDTDPKAPDSLLPIPSALVAVLADPAGASVTITQQPVSKAVAWYGAEETLLPILNANFNSDNGGFAPVIYGPAGGPWWFWNSTGGTWTNHGFTDCQGPLASGLNSPVITMPKGGGVSVTFAHRHSFEGFSATDSVAWDGGQLRISVNGGPFTTVPRVQFTQYGYINPITATILDALEATPGWVNDAWVGESAGYANKTLITSTAALGNFNPGDTLQIQFLASWDECSEGSEPNWEIDNVQVNIGSFAPTLVELTVGAESTYQYQPNKYMSYIWQRDSGSGFKDLLDVSGSTARLALGLQDGAGKYRCIVYAPGASATSEVATVTVTLDLTLESVGANSLIFAWPRGPDPMPITAFVLEQSLTMAAGSWTTVPTDTYTATTQKVRATVSSPAAGTIRFYRLRMQ